MSRTDQGSPELRGRERCVPGPRATRAGISLPVIAHPDFPGLRASSAGKRRAYVLMAVHGVMIAHGLHWLWAGQTLSPVEPSESMETLRDGRINAGFIFFGLALASTLLLGRWLCGWGCHLVAYQDLTQWLMRKLRIGGGPASAKPRAFRSRLLVYIPLLAALYMFAWPIVGRLVVGRPPPPTLHLTTTGFWDTFPGFGVAALTVLVCGVAVIYLLGAKGFCTYACPYGALFGAVDKLAVGRIRVTEDCNACGHCTIVCSSNVDVALEVKTYGMVVDPGCMKCLDCVSVCPNDALYYGLGPTPIGARRSAGRAVPSPGSAGRVASRRYDLTWPEELLALLVFAAAFFAFRGLYGLVPFLLSLGIAGGVTFLVMRGLKLARAADVFLQTVRLKGGGRLARAGWGYLGLLLLVVGLTGHSGWWRYHDFAGQRAAGALQPQFLGWQYQPEILRAEGVHHTSEIAVALEHFARCERWGLMRSPDHQSQLAWLYALSGDLDEAARRAGEMARAHPREPVMWVNLAAHESHRGRLDQARRALRKALELDEARRPWRATNLPAQPKSAMVWVEWGMFLAERGEADSARQALEKAVLLDPASAAAWLVLGNFLVREGRTDLGRRSLIRAVLLAPGDPNTSAALAGMGKRPQDFAAALNDYGAALSVEPRLTAFAVNKAYALTSLGRVADAIAAYEAALREHPDYHAARADLGAVRLIAGDLPGAIREYERLRSEAPPEAETALRLAVLYREAGRLEEALRMSAEAVTLGDESQRQQAEALRAEIQQGNR